MRTKQTNGQKVDLLAIPPFLRRKAPPGPPGTWPPLPEPPPARLTGLTKPGETYMGQRMTVDYLVNQMGWDRDDAQALRAEDAHRVASRGLTTEDRERDIEARNERFEVMKYHRRGTPTSRGLVSSRGYGDDAMAKKTTKKSGPRKQGSGAWIREQLLAGTTKSAEDLAAAAREKFGGKTTAHDVAWNRSKLYKEGKLKKPAGAGARTKKAAPKKERRAKKAGGRRGTKKTVTTTAEAVAGATE